MRNLLLVFREFQRGPFKFDPLYRYFIPPYVFTLYLWLSPADLSKNNITNITENNFRGQDNLIELDLSKNKILRMASSTFRHLTVSISDILLLASLSDVESRNVF